MMPMTLDRTDQRIVETLARDARLPMGELAARVGVSRRHCRVRLRALESRGIIRGYVLQLNETAIGAHVDAFVRIGLPLNEHEAQRALESVLLEMPEVLEAHLVTGEIDYLLRVRADRVDTLTSLITERLAKLCPNTQLRTSLVVRTLKRV
jgi:Lrp/AsnC family transcriptional regulator, leucine-responsive regulatory protein